MTGTESEDRLIAQAVAGDSLAMSRLLMTNYRRLASRIARKIPLDCGGTVSAEDVLQEAFAEAFRRIGSFAAQGDDAFYRWLVTITDHRLADMVKAQRAAKRGGGRQMIQASVEPGTSFVANLLDLACAHNRTPSRSLAGHEAASALQVALAGLKDDYREALRWRYIEGLPVAEIAVKMNRTDRAVHMLCNRALKELRAAMGRSSDYLSRKQ